VTKPINLNRIRKKRARSERKDKADTNAKKFGRTKRERTEDELSRKLARRHLDQHRLDKE